MLLDTRTQARKEQSKRSKENKEIGQAGVQGLSDEHNKGFKGRLKVGGNFPPVEEELKLSALQQAKTLPRNASNPNPNPRGNSRQWKPIGPSNSNEQGSLVQGHESEPSRPRQAKTGDIDPISR